MMMTNLINEFKYNGTLVGSHLDNWTTSLSGPPRYQDHFGEVLIRATLMPFHLNHETTLLTRPFDYGPMGGQETGVQLCTFFKFNTYLAFKEAKYTGNDLNKVSESSIAKITH